MGKSIVNAHSFKMDPSPPLALTPDSCWIQHSRAFTGTGCHSSPPTTAAPVHTHTQHVRAYVHSRLSAACTRSRFKGLCSQAHPLLYPLSISPFLILSLSLSIYSSTSLPPTTPPSSPFYCLPHTPLLTHPSLSRSRYRRLPGPRPKCD